jgi:FMN phosphatase YigB (HAD superfamily)
MAADMTGAGRPRTIIFDLGKVLVDFDHMTFCRNLAAGCAVSADRIHERIFLSGLENLFDSGRLSAAAFFEAARTELRLDLDMDRFAELWSDIFILNEKTALLLESLRGRYRLLCLSNTNPWHFSWCRRHFSVLEVFDDYILSYEEQCCKPEDAIFKKALDKAQAPASRCIYIDDMAANIRAAARFDMTACLFTSADGLARDLTKAGVVFRQARSIRR